MLGTVKTIDGVKQIVPLTPEAQSGAPLGSFLLVYGNVVPYGYLPCGVAFYNNTQQLSIPNKFMSFEKNSPTSNCIGMASDAWIGNPFTCVIEYTKAD